MTRTGYVSPQYYSSRIWSYESNDVRSAEHFVKCWLIYLRKNDDEQSWSYGNDLMIKKKLNYITFLWRLEIRHSFLEYLYLNQSDSVLIWKL